MVIGARIEALMGGLSQSELARRSGVSQATIAALIVGRQQGSKHLHKIARELGTTQAYLEGETDDPSENAPPPPPALRFQAVTLQVLLPSERALARMFEGLLRSMDLSAPVDAQALLLAKRLPIGLSQLRDLLPDAGPSSVAPAAIAADLATSVPEPLP